MIEKRLRILYFILITFSSISCCIIREGETSNRAKGLTIDDIQKDQNDVESLMSRIKNTNSGCIRIKYHYDLQGKELVLKDGCTLCFDGGLLKNGTIRGNNTKIRYCGKAIFDKVKIKGTWAVKFITTDMFNDLNYVNSLADVLALTNGDVKNKVIIKDYGFDYPVQVSSIGIFEAPLKLKSQTDLQLNGNIRLQPSNLFQYRIMVLKDCRNVRIHGTGSIVGDKNEHNYSIDEEYKMWRSHEWGYGIKISNCRDIEISGISVNNCTGDSFNIGEDSENILLYGVTADGSRRQGVTIAVASDVTIERCVFQRIGKENGTEPGAAVDVEPNNTECEIDKILIRNCKIKNCRNGIVSYSKGYGTTWVESVAGKSVMMKDGRHYVNIEVKDCSITGVQDAFSLIGWDKGEIKDCQISDAYLFLRNPKNFTLRSNEIDCKFFIPHDTNVENCTIFNNKISLGNDAELTLKKSIWKKNSMTNERRIVVRSDKQQIK